MLYREGSSSNMAPGMLGIRSACIAASPMSRPLGVLAMSPSPDVVAKPLAPAPPSSGCLLISIGKDITHFGVLRRWEDGEPLSEGSAGTLIKCAHENVHRANVYSDFITLGRPGPTFLAPQTGERFR